ncbi:MAG: DUF2484 family protein [Paracoccus sp. (in: a-proteobacteria)]|uniref:DUF2484 family protein n=1 Tax=Paracoccus sp. TaxID=267 RepID=UPI0026E090EF|nr:DUF2484 family protein [Paracoccus sp. (in: a-proteobacteria)]MDO5632255.1 DUF2484 family protein [Paracoccus sp. (in: a-proteobacteria)]
MPPVVALLASGVWLLVALLIPFVSLRWRAAVVWGMVLAGVPILGWLTLHWGPGPGIAGFVLGLLALYLPPRRRRDA